MAHRFPIPVGVQRWTYVVQAGDSLASIAEKFSGSADAWPGLVGANQHHAETEAEDGLDYEVLKLKEHDHLFIPAEWGNVAAPHEPGNVGALSSHIQPNAPGLEKSPGVYFDPMAAFVKAILALAPALEAWLEASGWNRPVGPNGQPYTPEDIANVLIGMLPAMPSLSPTPQAWDQNTLQTLYMKAALLLEHAQVAQEQTGIFRSIPWSRVPWNVFPWAQVTASATDPQQQAEVWRFLTTALRTSPIGYQAVSPSPAPNYAPDFKTVDWAQSPGIGDVPWGYIEWADIDPAVFDDPRVAACMKDADGPKRLADMLASKDCFLGKGPQVFGDYLCKQDDGTYKDLSTCDVPDLPAPACTAPAVWDPVKQACVLPTAPPQQWPPWANQIDWACQPSPQCIYTQLEKAVPQAQRCPPPGTDWPGCVPEWLASQYGLAVPEPAKKEEKKTDNTPMYVALGALGVTLLVGGVLVVRNRNSED